jgi:heat shock protein HspQ
MCATSINADSGLGIDATQPKKPISAAAPAACRRIDIGLLPSPELSEGDGGYSHMDRARLAKFSIGQVVKHRIFPFRGVVFDVDPVFNNTEEWWLAIPEEIRPAKDQPYYHLFAENADSEYIAYVSEQNLLPDESEEPLRHPQISEFFAVRKGSRYTARDRGLN